MEHVAFTYQSTYPGAMMTLFTKEDIGSEDYSLLEQRIGVFSALYLAFTHRIHPIGHKETKEEIAIRDHFYMEDFVLVAAEFNNEGITGYATAFIVSKENPKVGYVMELTGFQIVSCVYGPWNVKDDDGDIFSMAEVLDYFGLPLEGIKKVDATPAPRKEEEMPPAFTPTKKRVIQNLGSSIYLGQDEEEEDEDEEGTEGPTIEVQRMDFVANSTKKPGKIHLNSDLKPRKKAPEPVPTPVDEEDEEEAEPVEIQRMDFVANSTKKPSKIHLSSDVKPKKKPVEPKVEETPEEEPEPVEVPRMDFVANSAKKPTKIRLNSDKKKKKIPEAPKEDVVNAPVSITPDFTPTKKSQPSAIEQTAYQEEAELLFPLGPKNPNARLFIYFPNDPYVQGLFDEGNRRLSKRDNLSIKEACVFSPTIPTDEWKKPFTSFDLSSWRILALTVDSNDNPMGYLLGHASIKGLSAILDEKGAVAGVSYQGIDIRRPHFSYNELLSAYGISFPEGK